MDLIADTTLLVGLWRKQRWALDFAHANEGGVIGLPWIVLGEFWHGQVRFSSIGIFPGKKNVVFLAPVVTKELLES